MSDVTQLLGAVASGDRKAAADLLPLVYEEMRKLAAARMATEPSGHTLQPTALVHEAYLRLVGPEDRTRWESRGHFFAAAAEAMRRILVDHARRRSRERHGGGRTRVELEPEIPFAAHSPDAVLDVDAALTRLAGEDPAAAGVVNLHFFAGLSIEEVATCTGVSRTTAYEQWAYARAWLRCALRDGAPPDRE